MNDHKVFQGEPHMIMSVNIRISYDNHANQQ